MHKPKPPDTSELVRAYRMPSLALTNKTGASVLAALDEKVMGLSSLCGWDGLSSIVCDASEECRGCAGLSPVFEALDVLRENTNEDAGVKDGKLSDVIEGDGYVRITRICPGHEAPSPDPAHGHIALVVGFSERGFDPVVFGTAENCQIRVLEQNLTLSGELTLSFGASWGFGGFDDLRPVIGLSGSLQTAETSATLETDLELGLGKMSSVALRCDVQDEGNVVFFQDASGVGFRAKNGTFRCSFAEGTCANGNTTVDLK